MITKSLPHTPRLDARLLKNRNKIFPTPRTSQRDALLRRDLDPKENQR